MQIFFKSELDNIELENIKKFCDAVDYCSIEQSIGWTQMFYKPTTCYFYIQDESGIKSFSQIHERLRSAQIFFGPVCCEKEMMVTSINEIIKYYKKRKFYYLGIQMYYKSGFDTEYIDYALNKKYNIKYVFDNENTKSSIEIDLGDPLENIFKKLRENHKRNIKKALKLGLTFDFVRNALDLTNFIEVYLKMCKVRKINGSEWSSKNITEIYDYLIKNHKGQILLAKDKDNVILGGVILVYQGISVRYLLGASDPDRHDLPILHIILYEAIKNAKVDNFKFFDFWGYNHFAGEHDQVYHINHFKRGFGGYYTFFAKKMNISLLPNGYYIYQLVQGMRNNYKKIKNILQNNKLR